jgi:hypothetical protein
MTGTNLLAVTILSIASCFLAQWLLPGCRFSFRPLLSPLNWFLVLYFLLLVLVPCVVVVEGPSDAYLPALPSGFAMNVALILQLVGFWTFCGCVHHYRKKRRTLARANPATGAQTNRWLPPAGLIVSFALLGAVGIALRFGSFQNLLNYFTDPQAYLLGAVNAESKSVWEAAPDFLMYFAPFSMILLWCRDVALARSKRNLRTQLRRLLYIFLIAFTASLSYYSRASFVIPLVALFAVMLKRRVSIGLPGLLALVAVAGFLIYEVTSFRATYANNGALLAQNPFTLNSFVQDYGQAPQYLGYFLENMRYGTQPSMGAILYHSVLSLVPVVGKAYRMSTGAYLYGVVIERTDHPALFIAELFLDFSVLGVIAGFALVGRLVAALQDRFIAAGEPFELFLIQFAGVCLSYTVMSGIEEVAQFAIFLCWPVYAFFLYRKMFSSRRNHSRGAQLRNVQNRILLLGANPARQPSAS